MKPHANSNHLAGQPWTREAAKAEISKYTSFTKFYDECPGLYTSIRRRGWDDLLSNLERKQIKTCRVWTREAAAEVISRYTTLKQFSQENAGLYTAIKKKGWKDLCANLERGKLKWTREYAKSVVDQYTSHLTFYKEQYPLWKYIHNRGWKDLLEPLERGWKRWTREEIAALISKYRTIADFKKNEDNAYQILHRHGWKDLLKPLIRKGVIVQEHLWTKDKFIEIVKQCSTYFEFRTKHPDAYAAMYQHHWKHLTNILPRSIERVDKRKTWSVYRWLFPEEHAVYIGLSSNVRQRFLDELHNPNKSAVKPFMDSTGCSYKFTVLYENLTANKAAQTEIDLINRYRKRGYKVINRYEGGSLGRYSLETDEELIKKTESYSHVSELRQNDLSTYNKLRYRNILWKVHLAGIKVKPPFSNV